MTKFFLHAHVIWNNLFLSTEPISGLESESLIENHELRISDFLHRYKSEKYFYSITPLAEEAEII